MRGERRVSARVFPPSPGTRPAAVRASMNDTGPVLERGKNRVRIASFSARVFRPLKLALGESCAPTKPLLVVGGFNVDVPELTCSAIPCTLN